MNNVTDASNSYPHYIVATVAMNVNGDTKTVQKFSKDTKNPNIAEILFTDGTRYVGENQNGTMIQGKGKIDYQNVPGTQLKRIEAIFANGIPQDGQMTKVYKDGTIQIGTFKNDLLHGPGGTEKKNNLSEFTGSFYKGNWRKGYGSLISSGQNQSEKTYIGPFYKGLADGLGQEIVTDAEGNVRSKYRGTYQHGLKQGGGKYQRFNGAVSFEIEGEWQNGVIVRGTVRYPNGDIYVGELNAHCYFDGEGVFTNPNAKGNEVAEYKGNFYDGKKHG
jgi:hypothetical protein